VIYEVLQWFWLGEKEEVKREGVFSHGAKEGKRFIIDYLLLGDGVKWLMADG
jgi:hypothetical protein